MKEQDADVAIRRFREGTYNEKLSNDFVEVCVGPLFTREEEFHVQTLRAFRKKYKFGIKKKWNRFRII